MINSAIGHDFIIGNVTMIFVEQLFDYNCGRDDEMDGQTNKRPIS